MPSRDVNPISQPTWLSEQAGAHDEILAENWLLRLCRERFRSRRSGKSHDYFVVYLTDAVHVIAVTSQSELVMVRQFRAGSRRDCLETPGGLLEPAEDPCVAGARELLEETGYAGDPPEPLTTISPNPGLLAQRIATIVIRNARQVAEPRPDQSEELTIELIPLAAIPTMIRRGEIEHAVCIAGLLWWLAFNDSERPRS